MAVFLILGLVGLLLLVLALLFDGVLDAVTDAFDLNVNGLFSLPVIAAFVSTVGFGGMLIMGTTSAGAGLAAVGGVAAGVVVGGVAARISKALMDSPTDVTPSSDHLPGLVGTVVTPIPNGGFGEVMLRVAGQPVKFSARSDDEVALGASVVVVTVLSTTSVQVRQLPA